MAKFFIFNNIKKRFCAFQSFPHFLCSTFLPPHSSWLFIDIILVYSVSVALFATTLNTQQVKFRKTTVLQDNKYRLETTRVSQKSTFPCCTSKKRWYLSFWDQDRHLRFRNQLISRSLIISSCMLFQKVRVSVFFTAE